MTESIYKEYQNKYYNPTDNDKKPGDNDNWKSIQKGFHDISTTQLETSAGLTLGKGTEDETSVTAAELEAIKNPSQLETSGGLTLGKGTADEVSVTPAELEAMKQGGGGMSLVKVQSYISDGIAVNTTPSIITVRNIRAIGSLVPGREYKMRSVIFAQIYNGDIIVLPMLTREVLIADDAGSVTFNLTVLTMGNTETTTYGSLEALLEEG